MEKDKRQGWLKELKVGDEVFLIQGRGVGGSHTTISQVQKITPTGKINVDGVQFSPDGSYYGSYCGGSNSLWLKELTPENKQEYLLEKQRTSLLIKTRNALKNLNLDKMNTGELQALYDYIKSGNE